MRLPRRFFLTSSKSVHRLAPLIQEFHFLPRFTPTERTLAETEGWILGLD